MSHLAALSKQVAPSDSVQLVLAVTFLSFALLKPLFDGFRSLMKASEGKGKAAAEGSEPSSPDPREVAEPAVTRPAMHRAKSRA